MSIGKTLVIIFHKSRCFRIHRSPGIPSKDSWSTKKKGSVNDYVHNFCRVSVEKKWNNIFGMAEQNTFEPQKKWWNWKESTGFGISARLWYPRLVLIFYPKCQEMWDFNLSNISKKAQRVFQEFGTFKCWVFPYKKKTGSSEGEKIRLAIVDRMIHLVELWRSPFKKPFGVNDVFLNSSQVWICFVVVKSKSIKINFEVLKTYLLKGFLLPCWLLRITSLPSTKFSSCVLCPWRLCFGGAGVREHDPGTSPRDWVQGKTELVCGW